MASNTKARSEELQALAVALVAASGVSLVDRVELRPLYKLMAEKSGCHYTTAKQHIAKAMRRARGELLLSNHGGYREGGGRPRKTVSIAEVER